MDNGFPHFMPYGVSFATSGANASLHPREEMLSSHPSILPQNQKQQQ